MMADGTHNSFVSGRLPLRKPDADLWNRIEGELTKTNVPLSEKLPRHHPDERVWNIINTELSIPVFYRRRSIVASAIFIIMLLAPILFWRYLPEKQPTEYSSTVATENPLIPDQLINTHESVNEIKSSSSIKAPIQPLAEDTSPDKKISAIAITAKDDQVSKEKNLTLHSTDDIENIDFKYQSNNREIELLPLPPKNKTRLNQISSIYPKTKNSGSAENSWGIPSGKLSWEAGAYLKTTWTQHISSINSEKYFTPALGLSIGVRKGKTLFETGAAFSRFTYDDRVEIEYVERLFLGTLITAHNWVTEEYIDEDGMPQTRKKYIVELIDIYDSTFVEEVADDQVRLSLMTIPFWLGYRFIDNGAMFFDLNAGVDLMMIKGEVIAGNWQTPAHAEHLEIFHQFSDRFSLKWKYHFAVGMGYRITERQSVYLSPSFWWYPEKIENKETATFRNPVEAGVRIGVKWEF